MAKYRPSWNKKQKSQYNDMRKIIGSAKNNLSDFPAPMTPAEIIFSSEIKTREDFCKANERIYQAMYIDQKELKEVNHVINTMSDVEFEHLLKVLERKDQEALSKFFERLPDRMYMDTSQDTPTMEGFLEYLKKRKDEGKMSEKEYETLTKSVKSLSEEEFQIFMQGRLQDVAGFKSLVQDLAKEKISTMEEVEKEFFFTEEECEYFVSRLDKSHISDSINIKGLAEEIQFETFWLSKEDREMIHTKDVRSYNIPADLFFAKTIALTDFEVRTRIPADVVKHEIKDPNKKFDLEVIHRFCVEENYKEIIDGLKYTEHMEGCFHVGTFSFHTKLVGSDQASMEIIFPIFIKPGEDNIIVKKLAYRDAKQKKSVIGYAMDNMKDNSPMHIVLTELLLWYGIELAMIHPAYKEVFTKGREERVYIKGQKKQPGKKQKPLTRVVKKHFIKYENFKDAEKKYEGIHRTTMIWHVSGHWRHRANGKKSFVNPYWKGPLRAAKQNLDEGRILELDVPENNEREDET